MNGDLIIIIHKIVSILYTYSFLHPNHLNVPQNLDYFVLDVSVPDHSIPGDLKIDNKIRVITYLNL